MNWRAFAAEPMARTVVGLAAVSMSIRLAGLGLSYAANILLSRLLGIEDYGRYAIALSWVLVLMLPTKAGFDNSALRYATAYLEGNRPGHLRGFIRYAAALITAIWAVVAAGVVLVGPSVALADRETLVWVALLVLPLALLMLFSVLMRTLQQIAASQFYDQVLRPLLLILLAGGVVLLGSTMTFPLALQLTTAAAFVALGALFFHFRRAFRPHTAERAQYESWREWLAVSLPMLLVGVVQELMNQVDILLLGAFANAREAALFAASWRLASLVPFALVGLATIGGPLIASAFERRSQDEMRRVSMLVARLAFAFALVASLVLIAFGGWILSLYGAAFSAGYPVLMVLLAGTIVNAFTGIVVYFMLLTGKERHALLIFCGALALSLLLNILLIPRFGAVGAAVASSSATAAWNLAMLVYVRRVFGIDASAIALPPRARAQ